MHVSFQIRNKTVTPKKTCPMLEPKCHAQLYNFERFIKT